MEGNKITLLGYIIVILLGSVFVGFIGYVRGGLSYAIACVGALWIAAVVLVCICSTAPGDNITNSLGGEECDHVDGPHED